MDPQNRLTHRQESPHTAYAMCLNALCQVKRPKAGNFFFIYFVCSLPCYHQVEQWVP